MQQYVIAFKNGYVLKVFLRQEDFNRFSVSACDTFFILADGGFPVLIRVSEVQAVHPTFEISHA